MPEEKKAKKADRNSAKMLQIALGYLSHCKALDADGKKALAAEAKRLGAAK